jgi:indole-3-glycerol phosphate synthase
VLRREALLLAVEHRRRDDLEALGGPAGDVGMNVLVETEDLLDHDHPTLALAFRLGVQGGELKAVMAGGQGNQVGHRRS